MNYKMVFSVLGKTMVVLAGLMLIPMLVGIFYAEYDILAFVIPIIGLLALGIPLSLIKLKDKSMFAKEGFVIVALCWIVISLFGCIPFMISGVIPNFFDAFFETVAGFTTTGSSVLSLPTDTISMPRGIMFWRIFTHWIGGMGVLVFLLALLPSDGNAMHILRAESPGPSASKLVSKIRRTARILYAIYLVLTIIECILLSFKMDLYEAILNSFSTAGTGGFGIYGDSIAHYKSVYVEMVIATFMFLFGINFNLFYLILLGNFAKAVKSEEFITYLIIVVTATLVIALNLLSIGMNFAEGLRYAYFQTTSISSTTGLATTDFTNWPELSKSILIILTVIGASGGSTAGGIKVSRAIILFKTCKNGIKKSLHPRAITLTKLEGEPISKEVERDCLVYFILWMMIVIVATFLLALDNVGGEDVFTNLSAVITCIGNVGPGITKVIGPMGSFATYNGFSKIVLSMVMLIGRLEIFPIIILFAPRTWRKGQ